MIKTAEFNQKQLKRFLHSFGIRIVDEELLLQKDFSTWPNTHLLIVNREGKKEGQIAHNEVRTKLHFCYPYGNVFDGRIDRVKTNSRQLVLPFTIKNSKQDYYNTAINYDYMRGTVTIQDGRLDCKLLTFLKGERIVSFNLNSSNIYLKNMLTNEKIYSAIDETGFHLKYQNPCQNKKWKLETNPMNPSQTSFFHQNGLNLRKATYPEIYLNPALEDFIRTTCPEYYALVDQMVAYFQVPRQNLLCSLLTIIYEDYYQSEFQALFGTSRNKLRVKTYHRPCQSVFQQK